MTPAARSMQWLRKQGYDLVSVVERWNQYARIRQDLFGFADVIAVLSQTAEGFHESEFLLVQSTTASNHAARRKKILENDNARKWLDAGGVIEVHSWSKPTKTRRTWKLRREVIE